MSLKQLQGPSSLAGLFIMRGFIMDLVFDNEGSKLFEINLAVRDFSGNPTGKRRSFSDNDPSKICEFWQRHKGQPKNKKKKTRVPNAKEATSLLKMANEYAEEKQLKRKSKIKDV